MRARSITLGTLALLVAAASCDAPPQTSGPIAVQLAWRFADGRRCADAGAVQVNVSVGGAAETLRTFPCPDGERGATVLLDKLPSAAQLSLAALSPGGATLYRGDLTLDVPAPSTATATLYFLGGP